MPGASGCLGGGGTLWVVLPFAQVDTILTDRLEVRPFERADRDGLAELQRWPGLTRFLGWDPPSDPELEERLERKISSTLLGADGDQLNLAVRWRGHPTLIGDVTVLVESAEHAQVEVGYVIRPDHQLRGAATEAVRALLRLCFEGIGAHRVTGRVDARNLASAAVLERVGMRCEGRFNQSVLIRGEWTDEVVFAVLAAEWCGEDGPLERSSDRDGPSAG